MKRSKKVIITCAITGSIHTPTMSPHLPITPDDIVRDSVAAAEAGAAMIHLHARMPENGKPTQDPKMFEQFMSRIKQQTGAILNITTGGGLGMTLDQRLAPAKHFAPEVASMNMGSMNFNIAGSAAKIEKFKYDWERPYLESTTEFIMSNTFGQMERGMRELGAQGTKFEFECYDLGHLYNLAHFVDRKIVEPPLFIQCVFGVLGGMGADPENLIHMRTMADKLFGDGYYLSVLAAGRHQMPMITQSALIGGNCRVGLEDSLYISKGKLAESNAQQVAKIRHILEQLSLEVATPDEAREMIQTKGGNNVNF
jgi:uncharacterized protein (DUF849 family)